MRLPPSSAYQSKQGIVCTIAGRLSARHDFFVPGYQTRNHGLLDRLHLLFPAIDVGIDLLDHAPGFVAGAIPGKVGPNDRR